MQAKNGDTWETWRYLEAGVMVVKSIFTDSRGRSATLLCTHAQALTCQIARDFAMMTDNMDIARTARSMTLVDAVRCSQGHMYWYFEAIRAPAAHIAADQRRVVRVAGADTARLQVRRSPADSAAMPASEITQAAATYVGLRSRMSALKNEHRCCLLLPLVPGFNAVALLRIPLIKLLVCLPCSGWRRHAPSGRRPPTTSSSAPAQPTTPRAR